MKQITYIISAMFFIATFAGGCKESELQLYNGGSRVCFWEHSKACSLYGATQEQMPFDTIEVNINIMGYTVDHDRTVTGAALPDAPGTPEEKRLTTAPSDTYIILGGIVPAGKVAGTFKVVIKNVEELETQTYKLNVILTENEHFQPGLKENQTIALSWSRAILKPATWNAMRFFFCGTYSTMVYKIFMEVTGLKEFYYYQGLVSQEEGFVMARKFGDYVRNYNATHSEPLCHDDGPSAGLPIIPIH